MGLSRIGTSKHQHVGIGNFLLLVGQLQELLIYLVELRLVNVNAIGLQTVFQGSASRTGCEDDAVVVDTHILGVDNLVGMNILQHTILMDA